MENKNLNFIKMEAGHSEKAMEIFNYYAENTFAAYPERKLPSEFFNKIIEMTHGYPAYTIIVSDKIIGFCFLRAYNPFSVFKETAEISYFIQKEYMGKGIGKKALDLLEAEAQKMGIHTILASITSENKESLGFHLKYGFRECGRFSNIGKKFGRNFDVIWMEKKI